MKRFVWVLWFGAIWFAGMARAADDLPRHGAIGLVLGPGKATGIEVQRVVPGGAGEAAGFAAGDAIAGIDGIPVTTTGQFVEAIGRHLGGDVVRVEVVRAGERTVKTARLLPRPFETSPNADVLYRSVEVRGAHRRVIVTRPHVAGRLPAVLLMQGLGCYSLDNIDRQSGYGAVIDALERRGFVTMRVEKTGEGDSEGPACSDLSATPDLEAEGWLAGLRALKSYDFVDPAKVFVFAHSMGPVVGSLAIAREPVRGFIAVETVGTSWFEYDLERSRVQKALAGNMPDAVDRAIREYGTCSYRFFVEKMKPDELLKTPACSSVLTPFAPVPYTYMQAVADISLGEQWKTADFPVLVIYGTASPVTTARQNRYLAELINRWHPGLATYAEVPGMGHDLARYASPAEYTAESAGGKHPFHTGLLDIILPWIEGLLA
jgi:pimeloyl-ACP methyl ester carboxylesterase